jgi:translation initiation factor IF-3
LEDALAIARDAGLDLVEISPTAQPPVAKIMDKGKYFYLEEKKTRQANKKRKDVEIKSIGIRIGTGAHDLELKARTVDKFLKEGNKTNIDLRLRGREKYLKKEFLEERITRLLNIISEEFVQEQIKKAPRGLSVTISPKR